MSLSNPGWLAFETGRVPVSSLSARSSQMMLTKLPNDAGIEPLNLLEFKALREQNIFRIGNFIGYV